MSEFLVIDIGMLSLREIILVHGCDIATPILFWNWVGDYVKRAKVSLIQVIGDLNQSINQSKFY